MERTLSLVPSPSSLHVDWVAADGTIDRSEPVVCLALVEVDDGDGPFQIVVPMCVEDGFIARAEGYENIQGKKFHAQVSWRPE